MNKFCFIRDRLVTFIVIATLLTLLCPVRLLSQAKCELNCERHYVGGVVDRDHSIKGPVWIDKIVLPRRLAEDVITDAYFIMTNEKDPKLPGVGILLSDIAPTDSQPFYLPEDYILVNQISTKMQTPAGKYPVYYRGYKLDKK